MTDITPLIPSQPVPEVAIDLVGGGRFELSTAKPERFTLINFYRGLHCPQCKRQLQDLNRKIGEFAKRGIEVIAISTTAGSVQN